MKDLQTGPGDGAIEEIWSALQNVRRWVERNDYKGYEPFDGLSSWLRPAALGNQLAERILQQTIRQSPLNLRPILGVTKKDSTKGRGYMAWGYLTLYETTRESDYLERAVSCLKWLDEHKARRFIHHSWSNHFDFVSRGGSYTKDDPIIVWTSLIGHAFTKAFELTADHWFLEIADSACRWIMELPREETGQGVCISYLAHVQSSIHNANMLGAGLLARVGKHTGNDSYMRLAQRAMEYSCTRQREDGSWWYAEAPKYHWIDNFHTGYNLDSLDEYLRASGSAEFGAHLRRGLEYYKANFFEVTGRPKYYHSRTYPVDIQCAAQSIDTLSRFSHQDGDCLPLARKVAHWTIKNMQDSDGFFYYRQYPLMTAKTPMLHWGQATMFKALARLHQSLAVRGEGRQG